jgi:cytochrome o ubiquinol oxidase subunit 2
MSKVKYPKLGGGLLSCAVIFLGGCKNVALLDPAGPIGAEQRTLILTAAGLMLLVVVPVIFMAIFFAWRYRASNKKASYDPKWSHSTRIETVVWLVPAVIVTALGFLVWHSSHKLDPYRPLDTGVKPIVVEVVSLDWKWLFIYPDHNVATVNQLVFPANTPLSLRITSDNIMNSFFVPQLGSQIYAMPGMRTQLHLLADVPGTYDGISSQFSGPGFSDMNFKAVATSSQEFEDWLRKAKQSPDKLDLSTYSKLSEPSVKHRVEYFSSVKPNLFECILHKDMQKEMMADDCKEN